MTFVKECCWLITLLLKRNVLGLNALSSNKNKYFFNWLIYWKIKSQPWPVWLECLNNSFKCLNNENYGPKKKKNHTFCKSFLWRSVWVTLLILGYLNIENRKLLLPAFSFQIILLNNTYVNILKIVGPTD